MTASLALLERYRGDTWCARYFHVVSAHAVEHGRHIGDWRDVATAVVETLEAAATFETRPAEGRPC